MNILHISRSCSIRPISPSLIPRAVSAHPSPLRQITVAPISTLPNKFFHPIKYTRLKMQQIDFARKGYGMCTGEWDRKEFFQKECHLPDTFQGLHLIFDELAELISFEFVAWFAVTNLHLWMYNTRLRSEGVDGRELFKEIAEHLWVDCELKLMEAGVKTGLSKILADFAASFHGSSLAYDEGLFRGDPCLASGIWRFVSTLCRCLEATLIAYLEIFTVAPNRSKRPRLSF